MAEKHKLPWTAIYAKIFENMEKQKYIKKEVAIEKISYEYLDIIKEVISELIKFDNEIHSAYLYGSVATGKAKSPTSDLDILIVLENSNETELITELKKIENTLSLKYENIFREIGFAITTKEEILSGKESYGWNFFITILCIKIFGADLLKSKMDFLPTKKLAQNLHSDIEINIETAKKELQLADLNTVKLQIKSIMKKIIRTAFSIIMEEEQYWTTDLSEMTDIFIKYYPSKQQEFLQILEISKNDSTDKTRALNILNDFGEWIICEFSQKISNQIYDL